MYNMTVYSGKERECLPPLMTATDATVIGFTVRTENVGHKLSMGNSVLELFDYLRTETINFCTTVRPNTQVMPKSIGQKMKLQWGDAETRVG
jgi:hypothetical protein